MNIRFRIFVINMMIVLLLLFSYYFLVGILIEIFKQPIFTTIIVNIIYVIILFFIYYKKGQNFSLKCFKKSMMINMLSLITFLLIWFVLTISATLLYYYYGNIGVDVRNQTTELFNPIVFMFYSVVLAPFLEELMYRYIIYDSLKRIFPYYLAVILTNLIFAIPHATLIHLYTATIFGIFLCFTRDYYSNILVPISLHMIYNLLSFTFNNIFTLRFALSWQYYIIFLNLLMFLSISFLLYLSNKTNKNITSNLNN